ncbi:unnamed protein product [Rotaria sp. Silwood1]|nr:unnamed protein product [Rotaria sp. Silwood1]CAF3577094.1 unnamed protein product [Rotaria sp. Silwood1]CAF3642789.1 unnamed protein product [Rotaria sp. Silwood1]CAF4743572.1 unnamed protein product [Rotaria sp. Silwood1]CAF4783226.1 unnamed protein product [Rotaria sp. Silwood1]
MATFREEEVEGEEDSRFEYAHGTVMVLAWMVFASSAILFARYGRKVHFGSNDKLLGEKIWFQIHRFMACLTTVLTLLGFFFILVQAKGTWIGTDEGRVFVHSVMGGIVVCCALIQAWMALFRCHPDGSYRFIYNWLHRLTGVLAYFLSIPTIFIIITTFDANRTGMIVILSLWSAWVVIIVIILEIIRFGIGKSSSSGMEKRNGAELYDLNGPPSVNTEDDDRDTAHWHNRILILILINFIVSIALAIPLIVLIWK